MIRAADMLARATLVTLSAAGGGAWVITACLIRAGVSRRGSVPAPAATSSWVASTGLGAAAGAMPSSFSLSAADMNPASVDDAAAWAATAATGMRRSEGVSSRSGRGRIFFD